MGYQIYELADGTFGGYGVPCICTHPKCNEKIDRGVSHICGGNPHNDEFGCTLHFCEQHLTHIKRQGEEVEVCARCLRKREPFKKKPESKERVDRVSKDKSRAEWRKENPKLLKKWQEKAV